MSLPSIGALEPPLGTLLGRSWRAFGRSWGPLGPLLVGLSWGHLEDSEAHLKRKREKEQHIEQHNAFERFSVVILTQAV